MFKTIKSRVIFVIVFCLICIAITTGAIIYKNIEIDSAVIQKLIDNNFSERELEIAKTENQYRFDEYKFITEKE